MLICSLDVFGFTFSWQQPGNALSSCGTVISECQRPNFRPQCFFWFNFKACGLNLLYIVLSFLQQQNNTSSQDKIGNKTFCHPPEWHQYPFVGAYKRLSSLPGDESLYSIS